METITITKRVLKGKTIYYKRFDDYSKGFYGDRISKTEYLESIKQNVFEDTVVSCRFDGLSTLGVVERIMYIN